MTKTCNACNKEKPLEEFGLQTSRDKGTNFHKNPTYKAQCKACIAEYARNWRKNNTNYKGSGKITKYPEEDRLLLSAISSRLTDAKTRTKKYNKPECDVDRDYLYSLFKKQNGRCAYSGVELSLQKSSPLVLSLDQIDPTKGYIKDNVQWLAWAVNRAKGDMDEQTFLDMCRVITEKCND